MTLKREISEKQVIEWSVYAFNRRMKEGVTGPWWELIPDDQKPLAQQWRDENAAALTQVFGKTE